MNEEDMDQPDMETVQGFNIVVEMTNSGPVTIKDVTEWIVNTDGVLHVKAADKFLGSFPPGLWEGVYRKDAVTEN